MDSEQLRAHLAQAERHVAECRGHIARQRQVVEQLSLKDESREEAVVMLTILEDSLRIFEQHRACAAAGASHDRRDGGASQLCNLTYPTKLSGPASSLYNRKRRLPSESFLNQRPAQQCLLRSWH
jgi:hypothetical protein